MDTYLLQSCTLSVTPNNISCNSPTPASFNVTVNTTATNLNDKNESVEITCDLHEYQEIGTPPSVTLVSRRILETQTKSFKAYQRQKKVVFKFTLSCNSGCEIENANFKTGRQLIYLHADLKMAKNGGPVLASCSTSPDVKITCGAGAY